MLILSVSLSVLPKKLCLQNVCLLSFFNCTKNMMPCMSNILKYLKSLKCEMLLVLSERELRVNKCLVFRPRYDESGKGSSLSRRVKRLIA